jgi:hypothetical protein
VEQVEITAQRTAPLDVANSPNMLTGMTWGTGFDMLLTGMTILPGAGEAVAVERIALQGHHAIPKFLGGNVSQTLAYIPKAIHTEFHNLLANGLADAGVPLNVGGRGGSIADWAAYFTANPGSQRAAFDATLDASRAIDARYGTSITQTFWQNIMDGNFAAFP